MRRRSPVVLAALLALVVAPSPALARPAITIPGPLDGPLPRFTGAAATAQPLTGPWPAANPALAADGRSGSGLAPGNGAASTLAGPLGHGVGRQSSLVLGTCSSLAFDARDRLLALCNGILGPSLNLLDPHTLAPLSSLMLPVRPNANKADVAGGTHFLVRADGSLLVPANDGTLLTVAVDPGGLRKTGAISLKGLLASGERPFAVGAGYDGFDWVVGTNGTVVAVPRAGGAPHALKLGAPVKEDLATDPTGTYVITRDALVRLQASPGGAPRIVWQEPVSGSGTPPAIVAGGYVAVADKFARLLVMRIGGENARRLWCSVGLFTQGQARVDAGLVVAGRAVVASNAFGYDSLLTTEGGGTGVGGLQQVVVGKRGCSTAWRSTQISPSAQPVVSRANGLLYTVTKPKGFPDAWNLTAIDWRTGERRWSALAGEGLGFNSDGAAVALGPDGSAYAGSFGGVSRWHDG